MTQGQGMKSSDMLIGKKDQTDIARDEAKRYKETYDQIKEMREDLKN